MKRFIAYTALGILGLAATACAPQSRTMSAQWDGITASSQVAKVNNIQSLITPGFN